MADGLAMFANLAKELATRIFTLHLMEQLEGAGLCARPPGFIDHLQGQTCLWIGANLARPQPAGHPASVRQDCLMR
jgi:hypothetical protein